MITKTTLGEFENEAAKTRTLLERVPMAKASWKPHPKSMTLGRLAQHVAELWGWLGPTFAGDELDIGDPAAFAGRKMPATSEELMALFETSVSQGREALHNASDTSLGDAWTLRSKEQVLLTLPRGAVMRGMCMNHIYHHRGQLTVYLRLLDVPIPGMYGPSADE